MWSCLQVNGIARSDVSMRRVTTGAFLALCIGLFCIAPGLAQDTRNSGDLFVTEGPAPKQITVIVNKSRTINVGKPFARAMVGSVDYADVVPLSDRAIYIQGKKPGTTNVSLFDSDARLIGVLDLQVTLDTGNVQEKIRGGSGAQGIRVSSVQGQVVLSGTAVDAVAADRAVQVAKSLAGDQPIVNAMQVAPAQQVMLEVRFLEASRNGRARTWGQLGRNVGGKQIINTGRGVAVRTDRGKLDRTSAAVHSPRVSQAHGRSQRQLRVTRFRYLWFRRRAHWLEAAWAGRLGRCFQMSSATGVRQLTFW